MCMKWTVAVIPANTACGAVLLLAPGLWLCSRYAGIGRGDIEERLESPAAHGVEQELVFTHRGP